MILGSFFYSYAHHPDLHSFPTRRSSDLGRFLWTSWRNGHTHIYLYSFEKENPLAAEAKLERQLTLGDFEVLSVQDRKSTRLNSSHRCISYAVFCLKKKRQPKERPSPTAR